MPYATVFHPIRMARAITVILAILFAAQVFILLRLPVADTDAFWALRLGQWIVEHGHLPTSDEFLYTTYFEVPGKTPPLHEIDGRYFNVPQVIHWLSTVIFYAAYCVFGIWALPLIRIGFVLSYFCGLWFFCRYLGLDRNWALIAPMVFITTTVNGIHDRPSGFTLLFVLLVNGLWLTAWRRNQWRWAFLAIGLTVFWSHLHGGFLYGILLAWAWCTGLLASRDWTWPRAGGLLLAATVLPLLLCPTGIADYVEFNRAIFASKHLPVEMLPLRIDTAPGYWGPLLLIHAVAAVWFAWRRRFAYVLLIVGPTVMIFMAFRNVIFMCSVAVPFTLLALWEITQAAHKRWGQPTSTAVPATMRRGLQPTHWIAAVGAIMAILYAHGPGQTIHLQPNDYRNDHSGDLRKFLQADVPPGRPFNHYNDGGWLVWEVPFVKWFIDGRTLNLRVLHQFMAVSNDEQNPATNRPWRETLFEYYGITWVVIRIQPTTLFAQFACDPNWLPVFVKGWNVIYVQRTPETEAYLSRHVMPVANYQRAMLAVPQPELVTHPEHFATFVTLLGGFEGLGKPVIDTDGNELASEVAWHLSPTEQTALRDLMRRIQPLVAAKLAQMPGGEVYRNYLAAQPASR